MKALRYIKEWGLLTVVAFLLYLILWFPVIKEEFNNWDPFVLLIEFTYCGIFILTSMSVEYLILRKRRKKTSQINALKIGF